MEQRKTGRSGGDLVPRKRSNNRDLSLSPSQHRFTPLSPRATLFTFFLFFFFLSFFLVAGAIGYDVKIRAAVSRSGSKLSLPGGEKSVPRGDGKRWWWQKWVVAVKTRSLGGADRLSADLLLLLLLLPFFFVNLPSLSFYRRISGFSIFGFRLSAVSSIR